MNYTETIDFLFQSLPMFQRVGGVAYNKDLLRTIQMCDYLSNPQNKFTSIHIGGTNGKGSVVHFLGSVLQEHGLKVGYYTSPHYLDFRERIKINGVYIEEDYVVNFVQEHKEKFLSLQLSFFEMTVGMAFSYFADQKVDIALIEVGMGGRLDSTNVIHPIMSIITNISFDHMAYLGNTLPEIAKEKAGIVKRRIPLVVGERQQETTAVFEEKSQSKNANLYFSEDYYRAEFIDQEIQTQGKSRYCVYKGNEIYFENLVLDALGPFQAKNLVTTLCALEHLNAGTNSFSLDKELIEKGLCHVKTNTAFMGRWQVVNDTPLVICESAHNLAGFEMLKRQFLDIQTRKVHFVFGTVSDKDLDSILPFLPSQASYYLSELSIPRSMSISSLSSHFSKGNLSFEVFHSVYEAYLAAFANAKSNNDVVLIGGSIFTVADFLSQHKN
jgi:dihydrofolate synthase / folylpolyglutamate synthase